jgi:DNA-binding CsgD family transcriptional regulator
MLVTPAPATPRWQAVFVSERHKLTQTRALTHFYACNRSLSRSLIGGPGVRDGQWVLATRDTSRLAMDARKPTDTELLLELVGEAYSFRNLAQFRTGMMDLLGRVVPYDSAGFNEVSPQETFSITTFEQTSEQIDTFSRLAFENPLISRIQRTGDGRPYRISDMIDQDTFHALAVYQQFYRHFAVEYQVALVLPSSAPLIVGIALCREHQDFNDHEVSLLALARPYLMHAYRNAELWGEREAMLAALQEGLDTVGRHVVVLDPHGRVEFATDGAHKLLGPQLRTILPGEVSRWLASHPIPRAAAPPLRLAGRDGQILVRVLPSSRDDQRQVLLLEPGDGELTIAALRALGLTDRQAQSLHLLTLGRTPTETAARLGIARRTLDKHLQHAYSKLGVNTLTQATDSAWAAVGIQPHTTT